MRSIRPQSVAVLTFAALLALSTGAAAQTPPTRTPVTVQAGAPGEASTRIEAQNLSELGGVNWVEEDARFMQGMIPHHAQALQMTQLVREKSRDGDIRRVALRMEISQRDEIALMRRWLADRGAEVPASALFTEPDTVLASLERVRAGTMPAMDHGGMHAGDHAMAGGGDDHAAMGHGDGMEMMPGMLTPEELRQLAEAEGEEFDRLFLEYMIRHHEGAIVMVDALFAADGAGQESEIFQFASHVDADQRAEIARMRAMLEARMEPGAR